MTWGESASRVAYQQAKRENDRLAAELAEAVRLLALMEHHASLGHYGTRHGLTPGSDTVIRQARAFLAKQESGDDR